jgi:hypothetical protein
LLFYYAFGFNVPYRNFFPPFFYNPLSSFFITLIVLGNYYYCFVSATATKRKKIINVAYDYYFADYENQDAADEDDKCDDNQIPDSFGCCFFFFFLCVFLDKIT